MKKCIVFILLLSLTIPLSAQEKTGYKFYGFLRDDMYYNTRKNAEGVEGLFHLFPLDKLTDGDGKDLNAVPNSNLYAIATRLGVDFSGLNVGSAKLSGKIEADFTVSSSNAYVLYLRQAFISFGWSGGSSLLIGQAWHPMFGDVAPDMLDLSAGAPFQPFNRSPMVRYRLDAEHLSLVVAGVYQASSLSIGPNGKSVEYMKNSTVPELFAGLNYRSGNFLAGGGVEMISLRPRVQFSTGGLSYKVDERITTASLMGNIQYRSRNFTFAGKTVLASNLSHLSAIGGYGVSAIDKSTGEQEYSAQRHTTSWVDFTYGQRFRTGLFLGYSKNLGTSEPLVSANMYGNGCNIDRLFNATLTFSYNLPNLRIGLEYGETEAQYGTVDLSNGKVYDTRPINNHRLLASVLYTF